MRYQTIYRSPLGELFLSANETALISLSFFSAVDGAAEADPKSLPDVLQQTVDWLDTYFAGRRPDFTPPLELMGSEFQMAVWRILEQIPYGRLLTYGEIGRQIAAERGLGRMSAQAVGGAVGRNPIAIIVPCHRVIGAGDRLIGYGGGLDKKCALLTVEGHDLSRFK